MEDQDKKAGLAKECEKLDGEFEQELAEEAFVGETPWRAL